MLKIKCEQHAEILRWAVVGYGVSFVYAALLPLLQIASIPDKSGNTMTLGQVLWPTILGNVAIAIVCFIAGNPAGYANARPKSEGVLFALASIGFFPLGTILSAYMLVYLFVIYPDVEEPSSSEINE